MPRLPVDSTIGSSTIFRLGHANWKGITLSPKEQPASALWDTVGLVRRLVRQIKNLKLRSGVQRVGCYILTLAKRQDTNRVILPFEKNLIASKLGITRESFSRALSRLQKDGIAVQGEVITIRNPARLAAVSGPDPLIDGPEEMFAKDFSSKHEILQPAFDRVMITGDAKPDLIARHADPAMQAVADHLATGRAASLRDIAEREGITEGYVGRLIRLAFLEPSMVEGILEGAQPVDLTAARLTGRISLPLDWSEQHGVLFG